MGQEGYGIEEYRFYKRKLPRYYLQGHGIQDEKGSFTDENGKLLGERNIDKELYYWADVEGEYDAETMPYMVNGGKFSYFTKIVTQEIDKIINLHIEECGRINNQCNEEPRIRIGINTGRLHAQLWNDTCARFALSLLFATKWC